MGCSVAGKYAQMLFIFKKCHTIFFSCPPQKNYANLVKTCQSSSEGYLVGSQRQRARSILIWSEICNNNTKVVMSVADIVVYEDDRTVLRLTNAMLIPETWLDTYEWFAGMEACNGVG